VWAADSADVTAADPDRNRTHAPSGSTTVGLTGRFAGSGPARVSFTRHGSACSTG
jgi:hypothetical protein